MEVKCNYIIIISVTKKAENRKVSSKVIEMDVSELRLDLIDKIMHMKPEALKSIETVINDAESDWWDLMTIEEQADIDEGLKEIENGEVVPHSEVMKIFKK